MGADRAGADEPAEAGAGPDRTGPGGDACGGPGCAVDDGDGEVSGDRSQGAGTTPLPSSEPDCGAVGGVAGPGALGEGPAAESGTSSVATDPNYPFGRFGSTNQ
ncbi:hypothetical protein GCM10022231_02610 [Gordonia caeni]|uniref:Uncharacterized protein n=1 Tax=Gordonia caeni TaxID=1007097 RepID=A0ABP7NLT6_9ACTN